MDMSQSCTLCKFRPSGSELANAVVFARIESWLTGRRLVSLPFSDHCELLVNSDSDSTEILRQACWDATKNGSDFVEIRPITLGDGISSQFGFGMSNSFMLTESISAFTWWAISDLP